MAATTKDAYQLLHDGTLALSIVEANGVKIDTEYLDFAIKKTSNRIAKYERQLREDTEVYPILRKRNGDKTNIYSRPQLADVVFGEMGYKCPEYTESGKYKTDESAFEDVDLDYVKLFQELQSLAKLKGTYLEGIKREVTSAGFAHCNYNLNTAISYRGSCDSFNFQNQPVRDEEQARIVRRCFVPRASNRRIVEVDFSSIEVKGGYCYHKDPTMREYLLGNGDMHLDMASQLYCTPVDDVSKPMRHGAKNSFVFAQQYGDYYIHCAAGLYQRLAREKLATKSGIPVGEMLRRHGITELGDLNPKERPRPGTFEKHVKEVEEDFWGRRFQVYGQWKRDWWQEYQETGEFDTLTGFHYSGVFTRNEVINYPVQGSAFHCLLWSLIQIQRIIERRGLQSVIIGQIHDSIVLDVLDSEFEEVCDICRSVMTKRLPKAWEWIIIPLTVEIEAAEVGESWHDKRKVA